MDKDQELIIKALQEIAKALYEIKNELEHIRVENRAVSKSE